MEGAGQAGHVLNRVVEKALELKRDYLVLGAYLSEA